LQFHVWAANYIQEQEMKTKTKKERKNKLVDEKARELEDVWKCSSGCFSKKIFARKYIKIIFFLKNSFLTLIHQNYKKNIKKEF
jgi:hypothetical protein